MHNNGRTAEEKINLDKIESYMVENEISYTENDIRIIQDIILFEQKMNNAYKVRYKEQDIEIRSYIGTHDELLLMFFVAYKSSQYYKEENEEDKKINYKIFEQLKNIIFEIYVIFEFEIFDENELYKDKPTNEYELLYNLNKTQNLIIKTRIMWEKVMNFFYLLIERKDMKYKKSKKAKFEKWCTDSEIYFFDTALRKLSAFDSHFRTGEVHEFSKLKNDFEKGIKPDIDLYCLDLLFTFSNEVIINIMAYLNGKEPKYKMWQKLPNNITEQIDEFVNIPDWVKKYVNEEDIEDGIVINNYEDVKRKLFNQ